MPTSTGSWPADTPEACAFAVPCRTNVIIIVTLPIVLLYPFLQRYFAKGITIGSIQEEPRRGG